MPEQTLTRESLVEFFGEEEYERLCRHEAGHALIAFLFKRQIDYVRINNSKEKPSTTRMPGSSLDGAAPHRDCGPHVGLFNPQKFCVRP